MSATTACQSVDRIHLQLGKISIGVQAVRRTMGAGFDLGTSYRTYPV